MKEKCFRIHNPMAERCKDCDQARDDCEYGRASMQMYRALDEDTGPWPDLNDYGERMALRLAYTVTLQVHAETFAQLAVAQARVQELTELLAEDRTHA